MRVRKVGFRITWDQGMSANGMGFFAVRATQPKKRALIVGYGIYVSTSKLGRKQWSRVVEVMPLKNKRYLKAEWRDLNKLMTPVGKETCCGQKYFVYVTIRIQFSTDKKTFQNSMRMGRRIRC